MNSKDKDWDSKQYLKFERERTRPSHDLAYGIDLESPQNILDVGCGPGNSTQVLKEHFPEADILGIDNSADMIEKARNHYPEMSFRHISVTPEFSEIMEKFDIIFSNACIQWIPEHRTLIMNMFRKLKPGGVLAIQIPLTDGMPMYNILAELSKSSNWAAKIVNVRNFHSLKTEEYYDLACSLTNDFRIWETAYVQTIPDHEGIIEWYRGSGLRPYLAALEEAERPEFIEAIRTRLLDFYSIRENGKILMRFPRLFFTLKA